MTGRRRRSDTKTAPGIFTEVIGMLLMFAGFAGMELCLYMIGGLWVAVFPACITLMAVGYNMATSDSASGNGNGNRGENWSGKREAEYADREYVDPDEGYPTDTFARPEREPSV
jgi:hypothetical protein